MKNWILSVAFLLFGIAVDAQINVVIEKEKPISEQFSVSIQPLFRRYKI